MKGRWKSFIYVPVLAIILASSGMFIWNAKTNDQTDNPEQIYYLDEYFEADANKPTEAHAVDDKNVVLESNINASETVVEPQAEFVLRIVDDFVMVYRNGNFTESFMSTGIAAEELPEETRQEIINGKEILDEEALYFFLESHSS